MDPPNDWDLFDRVQIGAQLVTSHGTVYSAFNRKHQLSRYGSITVYALPNARLTGPAKPS